MQLVVDASSLVAEALRARGRALLAHSELDLVTSTEAWSETQHELRRRTQAIAQRGELTDEEAADVLADALGLLRSNVTVEPPGEYADALEEACRRVPRDPRDAPTVALALTLGCGILTGDYDFFGCGVPVWTVETLLLHLEAGGAS